MEKYFTKYRVAQRRFNFESRERRPNFYYWIENRSLMGIIGIDESNVTHPGANISDLITQESMWDTPLVP